jgi:FkbM family methyltransferase
MNDVRLSLHWAGARRHLRFPDLTMLTNFVGAAGEPFLARADAPRRVVDVGACCGGWTLALLDRMPNASFECFEPNRNVLGFLQNNLRGVNARIHAVACSNGQGIATLYPDPDNIGKTSLHGSGDGFDVQCVRLDDRLTGPVDLLKIDAEGHELAVLQGAVRLLAESRPWVVVELLISQQAKAGLNVEAVPQWLRAHGYGDPTRISGNDWLFVPGKG